MKTYRLSVPFSPIDAADLYSWTYVAGSLIPYEEVGICDVKVEVHHDPSIWLVTASIAVSLEVEGRLFGCRGSHTRSWSDPVCDL
jgi:hypothetical protein